jgi:hypothetical protein
MTEAQPAICCRVIANQQHSLSIQVSVTRFGTVPRGGQKSGENMKYLFAAVLVAASFAGFSAANAAGGCGRGFHRGPYGGCVRNAGVVVVPGAAYVAPRAVVRRPVVVVRPGRGVCRYGRCR